MEIFPINTRFFLPPSAQATASSSCSNLFLYVFFRTPEPRAVPCRHSGGLPVTPSVTAYCPSLHLAPSEKNILFSPEPAACRTIAGHTESIHILSLSRAPTCLHT